MTRTGNHCKGYKVSRMVGRRFTMHAASRKISLRHIVSLMTIVALLTVAQGSVMSAFAAEWELWPKGRGKATPAGEPVTKEAPPPSRPETPEGGAAAKAGEDSGKAVAAGATAGTVGKAALIAAGVLAVGIAAGSGGGGGGGGSTTTSHH